MCSVHVERERETINCLLVVTKHLPCGASSQVSFNILLEIKYKKDHLKEFVKDIHNMYSNLTNDKCNKKFHFNLRKKAKNIYKRFSLTFGSRLIVLVQSVSACR